MENYIDKKNLKSQNIHFIFLFILLLSYIIPLIIFGQITLFYHDTLDSEIVYNNILGEIYRGKSEKINLFLNGEFKIEFLRRLFHPLNFLYYFFNTELAYWLTDLFVKIFSYFSFYILAKKISSKTFLCGLIACLYASINDRTLDGFGFAIMPYIIYLISFKRNIRLKHFLVVAALGANTDLVYIIPVIPAVIAITYILNDNNLKNYFNNLLIVLVTFVVFIFIFNSNLIYAMMKYDDIHRISFYKEAIPLFANFISYLQAIVLFPDDLSFNFLLLFHKFIIFITIILITFLNNIKKTNLILILILIINFSIFLAGLSFVTDLRNSSSSPFLTFQFERISLLTPLLYLIILVYLIDKDFVIRRLVVLITIFSIFFSQINASITPTVKKYILKQPEYRNIYTFDGYYMFKDYKKIKDLVQNDRVLSVGFDPMAAVMNNIYVIDGYHNFYPLSYKKKFRKVIEKELANNEELKKYYDNWGNRVYAFINNPKKIELNFDEAKKIGAKFVISRYKIETQKLILVSEDFDNKIFLYKIN